MSPCCVLPPPTGRRPATGRPLLPPAALPARALPRVMRRRRRPRLVCCDRSDPAPCRPPVWPSTHRQSALPLTAGAASSRGPYPRLAPRLHAVRVVLPPSRWCRCHRRPPPGRPVSTIRCLSATPIRPLPRPRRSRSLLAVAAPHPGRRCLRPPPQAPRLVRA
eukprot:162348-Pleurochrysis_carterae.AAC.1